MRTLEEFNQQALKKEKSMFEAYFSKERSESFNDYKRRDENRTEILDLSTEFSAFINKQFDIKFFVLHEYSEFERNLDSISTFSKESISVESLIQITNEYEDNKDFPLFITCMPNGKGVVFVNLAESLGQISSIVDYIKENHSE